MNTPEAKAKWVLEVNGINGIPAELLGVIAESEGIKYKLNSYPDDAWDGMLLHKGSKKGILVNTYRGNIGRHHFTFAHELGHYFLDHNPSYVQNEQSGFRCTSEDMDKEHKPFEAEANCFAVELLMPENRFRLDMTGAPLDYSLISSLAARYMVSKHASSNRILDFTRDPCIVIITNGIKISGWKASRAARGVFRKIDMVPESTAAYRAITSKRGQEDFWECSADKWLCRAIPNQRVYECTRGSFDNGVAMTILKW
jgi:Zn-dependent peptidase ImmA (M78 family)